jgi:hypothetical protein
VIFVGLCQCDSLISDLACCPNAFEVSLKETQRQGGNRSWIYEELCSSPYTPHISHEWRRELLQSHRHGKSFFRPAAFLSHQDPGVCCSGRPGSRYGEGPSRVGKVLPRGEEATVGAAGSEKVTWLSVGIPQKQVTVWRTPVLLLQRPCITEPTLICVPRSLWVRRPGTVLTQSTGANPTPWVPWLSCTLAVWLRRHQLEGHREHLPGKALLSSGKL